METARLVLIIAAALVVAWLIVIVLGFIATLIKWLLTIVALAAVAFALYWLVRSSLRKRTAETK